MMGTVTRNRVSLREFWTELLDDAVAGRERRRADVCHWCEMSDTGRCVDCAADEDRAENYLARLDQVRAAGSDEEVAALVSGWDGGTS